MFCSAGTFEELKDSSNISVCEFALLSEENCRIIDQAYDTTACCMAYVLVENLSNQSYILLRYKGYRCTFTYAQMTIKLRTPHRFECGLAKRRVVNSHTVLQCSSCRRKWK